MSEWLNLWLILAVGVLLGLGIGLLIGLGRSRRAEIELAQAQERMRNLSQDHEQQQAVFRGVAAEVLQSNSDQFLKLAEQRLANARNQASADLDARKVAVEQLVKPLQEALKQLDTKTTDLERVRSASHGELEKHLRLLAGETQSLSASTTTLASALRGSTTGGRWGEIALDNLVEFSGMTEHVDFRSQSSLDDGGRPDLVINLPGDHFIAVDAKAPVSAYLSAVETEAEDSLKQRRIELAKVIRGHVQQLSKRNYADQLEGDVDYVVLFLPNDAILGEAFKADPDLQVEAFRKQVLIATPTILVALLRTVAYDWQRSALERNAQEIGDLAATVIERVAVYAEHLGDLGNSLDRAVEKYNSAANSFRSRVRPLRKQLADLTGGGDAERNDPREIITRVTSVDEAD